MPRLQKGLGTRRRAAEGTKPGLRRVSVNSKPCAGRALCSFKVQLQLPAFQGDAENAELANNADIFQQLRWQESSCRY